jgi:hypothetical protein
MDEFDSPQALGERTGSTARMMGSMLSWLVAAHMGLDAAQTEGTDMAPGKRRQDALEKTEYDW